MKLDLHHNILIQLIKEYELINRIFKYPEIKNTVFSVFKDALKENFNIDEAVIESKIYQVKSLLRQRIEEEELKKILVVIFFSIYFENSRWDDYINLARKKVLFKKLAKTVNKEGATYGQILRALKKFCEIPEGDLYLSPSEVEGMRVALINYFISNQLSFISIAKNHITVRDVNDILENTYRSKRRPGRIGGKAAGMYLAYRILVPRFGDRDKDLEKYIKIPESYYFNSGIFSEFIDYNDLYEFHTQKYKTLEEIQKGYEQISELFKRAKFPDNIVDQFKEFLKKVGEHPLILRSSSLLEDNFGYAFSGKYDSVFLANQGDIETRLEEFILGLKQVHMSAYSPAALIYRRDRNLLDFDERMSVLVQKVVGRRVGNYFFPFAAGVGFSYSSYSWSPKIDKNLGMVRLVLGLGTRAVDRVGGDYPRMIYLSHPSLRPEVSADQIVKYSQKFIDVLDIKERCVKSVSIKEFIKQAKHPEMYHAISIIDNEHISSPLFKKVPLDKVSVCITFDNLIKKTKFIALMKKVLKKLEEAYNTPVDVEFAWDNGILYILQCRPLFVTQEEHDVEIPHDIPDKDIIFTTHMALNNCKIEGIKYVIYVDPKKYATIPSPQKKIKVGHIVGKLNRCLEKGSFALFGPGRWGSNDLNLGVKVTYEDINRAKVLAEVAFEQNGSTPEVSYGTHFFNDLVESQILPLAIFPNHHKTIFKEDFFKTGKNLLTQIISEAEEFKEIIYVILVPNEHQGRYLNIYQNSKQQFGVGFLCPPRT